MFDDRGTGVRIDGDVTARVGWREVDRTLRRLAREQGALDRELGAWLLIAERTRVHRELGYGSFFEYVERVLGWGPRWTEERLRVARELETLPKINAALAAGTVSYSVVRDLTRVAEQADEDEWLATVDGKTAREVRAIVAGRGKGSPPTDPADPDLVPRELVLRLQPQVYAMFLEARKRLEMRMGARVSEGQLVAAMCEALIADAGDSVEEISTKPAYQVALTVCSDCSRARQHGGGQAIDVSSSILGQARCDGDWHGDDGTSPVKLSDTVPSATRRHVLLRDHACCAVPGCRVSRHLHIHHIEWRAHGGGHELWNLITVCSAHHAAIHDGKLFVTGTAPHELRWTHSDGRTYGMLADDCAPATCCADVGPAALANRPATTGEPPSDAFADARSALRHAGFTARIADAAVEKARAQVRADAPLEDLIRAAFRETRDLAGRSRARG